MPKKNVSDELLKRLNEYNESLLEDDDSKKKQKKTKQLTQNDDVSNNSSLRRPNSRQKKKERKKRKQEQLLNTSEPNSVDKNILNEHSFSKMKGEKRTLLELRNELGLEEYEQKIEKEKKEKQTVSTATGPEVVVFENPSKRKRKNEVMTTVKVLEEETIDLKKARYEVRKFGIKGLDQSKKEEAMVAMLVQLGAKPPKNKYYNYKEYAEKRKSEIEQQKKQKEIDRGLGYKVAPNRGKRRQKDRNDVGGFVDGQVGRFKHGVQFVNKHELKGFNNKRKK